MAEEQLRRVSFDLVGQLPRVGDCRPQVGEDRSDVVALRGEQLIGLGERALEMRGRLVELAILDQFIDSCGDVADAAGDLREIGYYLRQLRIVEDLLDPRAGGLHVIEDRDGPGSQLGDPKILN